MRGLNVLTIAVFVALLGAASARAQLPFYTDDAAVTARGTLHFEFFNEYDALQTSEFPDLHQNTANFKINYGLPHNLELDLDAPYLSVLRAPIVASSKGIGDTELGVKWIFHKASQDNHLPALGASLYFEFPTGDTRKQLSSGETDYWLTLIAQQPISDKTRVNGNFGYLFAGNTSTGALGIETTRGHVFVGGVSVLHDFTRRLTLGFEAYGARSSKDALGRSQLQFQGGGQLVVRRGLALTMGLLGGKYEASPRIGGQVGFSMDFPDILRQRTTQ